MRFEGLKNIVLSWNPRSYRKQIVVKKKIIFRRVFFGILLSLFLMLLVSLPLFVSLPRHIEEKASLFEELSVNVSILTSQEIEVSKIPRVIINTAKENVSREKVLINNEGIIINKHLGRDDKIYAWSSLTSAKTLLSAHSKDIQIIILLLIPSLLIAVILGAIIESILLVCATTVLAKIMHLVSGKHISMSSLVKITSLALIPFFMLQIIPLWYVRWWSIPLLAYVLIVISASYFVSDHKGEDIHQKKYSSKSSKENEKISEKVNEKIKKKKQSHEIHFSEDKD